MKYKSFLKYSYGTHSQIVKYVKKNNLILDVGCAQGYLDQYFVQELNCTVYGIEYDAKAAKVAKKFCADVLVGDAEQYLTSINKLPFPIQKFDVILLADVLEHLKEPEKVLQALKKYLKPEGIFIISLPNIAHFTIRLQLLFGGFNYVSAGILDNTHLKFFTRYTMNQMFERCNLTIESQRAVGNLSCLLGKLGMYINQLIPGLQAVQFLTVAKNKYNIKESSDKKIGLKNETSS